MTQLILEEILDTSTLKQYVDVIGYEKFLQSVHLFEKLAPDYIQQFSNLADTDVVNLNHNTPAQRCGGFNWAFTHPNLVKNQQQDKWLILVA